MATANETALTPQTDAQSTGWFAGFETALAQISDHLNPILIKEARQALKSRQFTVTFILVLVAGWFWSIFGIAWMGPDVYWSADGTTMFFGYFLILAFPLIVVVPYGAFRSLASEREDRTYELLSITTLHPRQVVGGKLAGAMLQMLVYLSAISPCLAFTYLLRGIDILTIVMILLYLVLGSLGLSLLSLMMATATSEKYQQVVLSVGFVLGLGYTFIVSSTGVAALLSGGTAYDVSEFWVANAAALTWYSSYFVLFFLAASAQLSFAASNRSTPLRIVTFIQQALLFAWLAGISYAYSEPPQRYFAVALFACGYHWYLMGVFMTGEPSELSPRVKRDLPQSFLGRAFFTWFNPGPASGYMFALTNYLGAILFVLVSAFLDNRVGNFPTPGGLLLLASICFSYLVFFLGVGRLLLSWLGRYFRTTPAVRVLVHFLLLFVCIFIPLTIHLTLLQIRGSGYTLLQITNPIWTLVEASSQSPPSEVVVAGLLLPVLALIVFLLNLPAVAEEVRQVRIALPARITEEDAELAAADAPTGPVKTSPWD